MTISRIVLAAAASLIVPAASAGTGVSLLDVPTETLDPSSFDQTSFQVTNEWLPLKPGTRLVYKGVTMEDDEQIPHTEIFTVTDLTKVIDGVRAVAVSDKDYRAEVMIESELVFFAQDKEGNVWHLGQYRETYDEEEFVGGRAWLSGLEGAKAGIMMKAKPTPGTPSYSEGYAPPPYKWVDRAQVDKVGEKTCVPMRCYEDVLVTDEFEPHKPDAHQLKFYAKGVGFVRVGWRGEKEAERETLELVKVEQLGPDEMAELRAEALMHEARANTYSRTPPAEPMTSGE
ncbi:hypothetical protein [Mesorhizobium silamurunense]|uniref:hypothetical protein n=1 Tax=Mesorhizobium silamurunense TaxID=499528 RepID=UPI00177CC93C|nr:hypothetical protein [Mesorhizobium silamurunense]